MFASRFVTPSIGVDHQIATSARSSDLRAMMTESFSAISVVLPLRRIPAVSIRRKFCPSTVKYVSIASRVVPGDRRNDHALLAENLIQQ